MSNRYEEKIHENGWNLELVPEGERKYELCLAAVQKAPHRLGYNESIITRVPLIHRTYELCFAAVKRDGDALRDVPLRHRDKKLCMAAVSQNAMALIDVPEDVKDKDICIAAVEEYGMALIAVPHRLLSESLVMKALHTAPEVFQFVPEKFKTLRVCRYAVRNDWSKARLGSHVPPRIQNMLYEGCPYDTAHKAE